MYRIAIVSRGWYPYILGGADKFIACLAEGLYKRGYEIIGITRIHGGLEKLETEYRLIIIRQKRLFPIISSVAFSYCAARIVNNISPDVAIVNGYWAEASPVFIRKSIPVIVVIHDVGLFRSEWARRHRLKHFLRVQILRRVVGRADKIVVPVEAVKNDLIRFLNADPDKIVVLGGEGIDGPMRYEHVDNEYFDIVQVGRFAPNKGQLVTLKAFKKIIHVIPNARLWLVGGRPLDKEHKRYYQEVVELANKINMEIGEEVVKIIVDAPDVSIYYRLADICVASSTGEEGYGLVVAECMAYGKPVIASDIFKETGVARPDRALIYRRGDHEDLAKCIIELYSNRHLYERLSKNALRYARSINWDAVVDLFVRLINNLKP